MGSSTTVAAQLCAAVEAQVGTDVPATPDAIETHDDVAALTER